MALSIFLSVLASHAAEKGQLNGVQQLMLSRVIWCAGLVCFGSSGLIPWPERPLVVDARYPAS